MWAIYSFLTFETLLNTCCKTLLETLFQVFRTFANFLLQLKQSLGQYHVMQNFKMLYIVGSYIGMKTF